MVIKIGKTASTGYNMIILLLVPVFTVKYFKGEVFMIFMINKYYREDLNSIVKYLPYKNG